jgi:hypothetical protein
MQPVDGLYAELLELGKSQRTITYRSAGEIIALPIFER